jgi:hypothetical protein
MSPQDASNRPQQPVPRPRLPFAFAQAPAYNFNDIPELTSNEVTATGLWTGTVPCATSADVTLTGKEMSNRAPCSALRVSQERRHVRQDSPVRFTQ